MKKVLLLIAMVAPLFTACKHEDDEVNPIIVDTTTKLAVDTSFLAGKDSLSWKHITQSANGVLTQTDETCERMQAYTFLRNGHYHFYSLPGASCGPYDNHSLDHFVIKGDSLLMDGGSQAAARVKIIALSADTLRVRYTDLDYNQPVVYIQTYIAR